MKQSFITLVLLLVTLFTNAQSTPQITQERGNSRIRAEISKIHVRSTKPLIYSSRSLEKDTIYITVDRWNYEPVKGVYTAFVVDYIKVPTGYQVINSKTKTYTRVQVDGIFIALNNSILLNESYSSEMDSILTNALLQETKTDLSTDNKTIYVGNASDWVIISN